MRDGSIKIRSFCDAVLYNNIREMVLTLRGEKLARVWMSERELPVARIKTNWAETYLAPKDQAALQLFAQ